MDEAALIEAARSGDVAAFNRLVLTYQGAAYHVALQIMKDEEAAADATQDAFLKAYKALDGLRGRSFKPWLIRIVKNTCYDQLRVNKRKPTTGLDDLVTDPEHAWRFVSRDERPEAYAEREELNRALQWAIAQLPVDQRVVVVLVDVEGFSYEEAAEALGVALGTVKSRLSRARVKLRDLLRQKQELLPARYRLKVEEVTRS